MTLELCKAFQYRHHQLAVRTLVVSHQGSPNDLNVAPAWAIAAKANTLVAPASLQRLLGSMSALKLKCL